MNSLISVLTILVLSVSLIACEEDPASPGQDPGTGELHGSVNGSEFVGTGIFTSSPDLRLDLDGKFQFQSTGTGSSNGEVIFGVWFGGGHPAPASYPVVIPNWNNHQGFWLFYERNIGGIRELFAAKSGTFDVEESTADEVRGSFQVEAWLACNLITETICPDFNGEVTGSETIDVSGSFSLVQWDPVFNPL